MREVILASLKAAGGYKLNTLSLIHRLCIWAQRTDYIIKQVLTELGGYGDFCSHSGKLWEFKTGNAICSGIAHQRGMRGHKYRMGVIAGIKQLCAQVARALQFAVSPPSRRSTEGNRQAAFLWKRLYDSIQHYRAVGGSLPRELGYAGA